MLGVLCGRPKPWILSALSFTHGAPQHRLSTNSIISSFFNISENQRLNHRPRHHSSACKLDAIVGGGGGGGGAASIWHGILPSSRDSCRNKNLRLSFHHEQKGEGSWNVAWDARPARWLHGSDSAWLLFGVCACVAPFDCCGGNLEAVVPSVCDDVSVGTERTDEIKSELNVKSSEGDYKVTGVTADGRCLFRAVVHGACLRNGENVPDENRQKELADDLRVQVVDELLKRRKETEWFIEGDFDAYVKSIQEPNAWGGEPELLMASHVLRTPISVFMRGKSSGNLTNISNYGQEYAKDEKSPIKVLFHGYGHYDVLETSGSNTP